MPKHHLSFLSGKLTQAAFLPRRELFATSTDAPMIRDFFDICVAMASLVLPTLAGQDDQRQCKGEAKPDPKPINQIKI